LSAAHVNGREAGGPGLIPEGGIIMTMSTRISQSLFTKSIAFLVFLSAVLIIHGCGHHRQSQTATVGSHKVILDRQGVTNRFGVEERGQLAVFRYDGFGMTGKRLNVEIENDKVTVNNKSVGMLKLGDVVHIGDDGITVNSLDYGESAKYLEANAKIETALTVEK
jgi:hypothetical protein